jgi:molecular chaperone GrpE (heat shock protein)
MNDVFLSSDEEINNYSERYIKSLINDIENKVYKMNKSEILSVLDILNPIITYINNNLVDYSIFLNTMSMIQKSLYEELKFKDSLSQINSQFKKFGFIKTRLRTHSV